MNNLTKLGYVNGVYTFKFDTFGVCPKNMFMKVDDNKRLIDLKIMGGCDGNSKAVSILVTGLTLEDIITKLRNLTCNTKPTSCGDQLAVACEMILESYFK